MSVRTLEESFANFLAVNTKDAESVPEPVDCPICMEVIVTTKNIVVTECGHTFHCSCLMANVAHNGFSCPYCRTAMAEEVDVEQSEYEDDGSITDSVDAAIHEDDMLRGFRMFHNLSDGIEHEQVDIVDEKFYQAYLEQEAMDIADLNVIGQNNNNSTENQPNTDQEPEWDANRIIWNDVANAAAQRDALVQNESNPDQEPEWDANGDIWNAIANATAERDAARDADTQNQSNPDQEPEWDANGDIWNAIANAAAERDADTQNQSNPDQETYWDNLASVAADYRAAPSDDEYATYWDNIANTAAVQYDDDHYEEYSFSDRYHDDEESLWSDDDDDRSECGFQQDRGIYPNTR
jgi:hypothetical protein